LSEKGREKFLRILAKLFKIGGLNQILFENMVYIWKIGNIEGGGEWRIDVEFIKVMKS